MGSGECRSCVRRAVGPRWSTGLRWPRRCLGTFRSFGRSAMSARVTERIGWGRGARGAYRSVRSRVGRVWERGMGSCEVGAIRYGSRVFYGRDLLGRILGSESRSYLGVEIGSRVEIVSRFRCVDFSRFVEVTSCLNSRLIKFGSIVFSRQYGDTHNEPSPSCARRGTCESLSPSSQPRALRLAPHGPGAWGASAWPWAACGRQKSIK